MNNINGVYRSGDDYACINGVWRNVNNSVMVNGVWRNASPKTIDIDNIKGLCILYTPNKVLKYQGNKELQYNENIPYSINTTSIEFDGNPKSIIFQYTYEQPRVEGIVLYTSTTYFITWDNEMFNVDEFDLDDDLKIYGSTSYESIGVPVLGWNQFYSTENNIPTNRSLKYQKNVQRVSSCNIFPTYRRHDKYHHRALIGIARDMKTYHQNMVGSHGTLDHTITKVILKDKAIPFILKTKEI